MRENRLSARRTKAELLDDLAATITELEVVRAELEQLKRHFHWEWRDRVNAGRAWADFERYTPRKWWRPRRRKEIETMKKMEGK